MSIDICVDARFRNFFHLVKNSIFSEHFRGGKDFEEYAKENILDFQDRKQDQEIFLD